MTDSHQTAVSDDVSIPANATLYAAVEFILTWHLPWQTGVKARITATEPISGGCIHTAERIDTTVGTFFLKSNDGAFLPNFKAEAQGLTLLAKSGTLRTPHVVKAVGTEEYSFLLMEYIERSDDDERTPTFWEDFGRNVAALHHRNNKAFGLVNDNFIGALPQQNHYHKEWREFFIEERLEPMIRRALDTGQLGENAGKRFERLFPLLDDYFSDEPPALLHGDLWSGNYLADEHGNAVLVDPAVYYGHREAEIAFMHLFGGFDARLFDAYNEVFPLFPDWQDRIATYNLYPLLVHVNLFGRSYWSGVEATLRKFGV